MAVYQGAHTVLGRAGESLVEWADGGVSAQYQVCLIFSFSLFPFMFSSFQILISSSNSTMVLESQLYS
jgi:hypothetical protein